jgi:Methyltransferase domain
MVSEDLWAESRSWLRRYLDSQPQRHQALRAARASDLNAADLMFRSMLLEEEARYEEAAQEAREATERAYLPEYLRAARAEVACVSSCVEPREVVFDLASGRGTLVSALLRAGHRRIVASDVSPLVLRRSRQCAQAMGGQSPMASLACDVAAVPAASGSIETATTMLGLPNLADPVAGLVELRRFVRRRFLAVHYFAPGASGVLDREDCLEMLHRAGWCARVDNEIVAPAAPTPVGSLVEGAQIDRFPTELTTLTWCVIVAT